MSAPPAPARLAGRFDAWLNRGPFTARGLGIFRILCAIALLATQRSFSFVDDYPSSVYSPPPGPFQLLPGLPPHGLLTVLSLLVVVATVLMGIGLATRWASLAVSALSIVELGISYSFGKIDHSIILAIAPGVLSFANWGASLSLDALLRGRRRPGAQLSDIRIWPLRIYALCIGISFATAAISKIRTGWFSPSSQVVLGYFLRYHFTSHSHNAIADLAASIQSTPAWEAVDWIVVLFESAMALAFLSWRFLRIMIAIATLFHLGVILLLGIDFEWDVVGYGAFVGWGRVPLPRLAKRRRGAAIVLGVLLIVALGVNTALSLIGSAPLNIARTGIWIICAGAAIGVGYLVSVLVRMLRRTYFVRPGWADAAQPMARWSGVTTWAVIVLLLVSLPLTYTVKLVDAEPYPALFQPDFNGPGPLENARVHYNTSQVDVVFTDGTSARVPSAALVHSQSETDTDELLQFAYLFRDNPKAQELETRAWVARALDDRFAPRVASRVVITWVQLKYDHISGKLLDRVVRGTTVLRMPDPRAASSNQ